MKLIPFPALMTYAWQLPAGPGSGDKLRRLATMMVAIVAGTLLGIGVPTGQSAPLAGAGLGVIQGMRFVKKCA